TLGYFPALIGPTQELSWPLGLLCGMPGPCFPARVKPKALAAITLTIALSAQAASASSWTTADLKPYHQPEQIVTTTTALLTVARGLTCPPVGSCSWTETLAGLPAAEDRARAAGFGWVAY